MITGRRQMAWCLGLVGFASVLGNGWMGYTYLHQTVRRAGFEEGVNTVLAQLQRTLMQEGKVVLTLKQPDGTPTQVTLVPKK